MKKIFLILLLLNKFKTFAQNEVVLDSISSHFANYVIQSRSKVGKLPYNKFIDAIGIRLNSSDSNFLKLINKLHFAKVIHFDSIASLLIRRVYNDFFEKYYTLFMNDIGKNQLAYLEYVTSKSAPCIDKGAFTDRVRVEAVMDRINKCMLELTKDSIAQRTIASFSLNNDLALLNYASEKACFGYMKYSKEYRSFFYNTFYETAIQQTDNILNYEFGFGNYFKHIEKLIKKK
jgi:hypothetical protein